MRQAEGLNTYEDELGFRITIPSDARCRWCNQTTAQVRNRYGGDIGGECSRSPRDGMGHDFLIRLGGWHGTRAQSSIADE